MKVADFIAQEPGGRPPENLRLPLRLTLRARATSCSETPTEAQRTALQVARDLIAAGVPVFRAKPDLHGGVWNPLGGIGATGYWLQKGWESTLADPAVLDQWRPGDALCAVMGHTFDALDVDPRHDGDQTAEAWKAAGDWPDVYGQQQTPSGGTHDLVARLGIAKTKHGGIDVQAGAPDGHGRSFIFLAPTMRISKATGELAPYTWIDPPNPLRMREASGDKSGLRLVARLGRNEPAKGTTAPRSNQPVPTLEQLRVKPPKRGIGQTNEWLTRIAGHHARRHRDDRQAYLESCRMDMALVDSNYEDFDKTVESVWAKEQGKPTPEDGHAQQVAAAVERMRVQHDAKRLWVSELALLDPAEPFDAGLLTKYIGLEEATKYRVGGLMLLAGSTIVSAKRKTGKTTFNVNLARCLVTGDPFLDSFPVEAISGRVAILNYEVTGPQLAHWAERAGVPSDRMVLVNLRGRRNPLGHRSDRAVLAEYLRVQQVEVVMVDPFGRAFTGANQNDVSEVGSFLTDLDLFTRAEVGATDLVLSVHTGWNGERSRGSSGLEDWPDSIIRLTTHEDDETGPRYLSAIGRDVEVAEDQLELDPATSRLRLTGSGSRKSAAKRGRQSGLRQPILQIVTMHPGVKSTELSQLLRESGATFQKGDETQALRTLVEEGQIVRRSHRNAQLHYLPETAPIPLAGTESEEVF